MKETCDSGAHVVAMEPSRPAMAIVTSPDSDVDHPAQLADLPIAVNFHAGSHFACIRMLEGFLGQKHQRLVDELVSSGYAYLLMDGSVKTSSMTAIRKLDVAGQIAREIRLRVLSKF